MCCILSGMYLFLVFWDCLLVICTAAKETSWDVGRR